MKEKIRKAGTAEGKAENNRLNSQFYKRKSISTQLGALYIWCF